MKIENQHILTLLGITSNELIDFVRDNKLQIIHHRYNDLNTNKEKHYYTLKDGVNEIARTEEFAHDICI